MLHHVSPQRHNLFRLGAAAFIPELLTEQGLSTQAALGFGRRRTLAQLQPIVPLGRLGLAFRSAAAATVQAEFGLLVGLRAGSRLTDFSEDPAQTDAHVSTVLLSIIARPAIFPNSFLTLSVSGTICTISCVALPSTIVAGDQLTYCAMGFATGALRVLCGPRWRALGFHFAHRPPRDPSRFAALLQAPVSFDANITAMEFESAWVDRHHVYLKGHASDNAYEEQPYDDPVGEVRTILASWNATDRPSAPAVASLLGLQPRKLNRLLARTGTRFNRMLGDTRYDTAKQMLRDPAVPMLSIAWSLGYADASAFSRAFRRWSGMTPSEWRKAAESGTL